MSLYGPKELSNSMRTVRKNTILIAEDIPEKGIRLSFLLPKVARSRKL